MMFSQRHRLGDVGDAERRARIFQPRRGRHAGRHLHMHVDRHRQRLVMHQPDARQPEHVGDLVRIDEHRGRAVRDHRAAELRHRHHAALDMHVPVAEPRHEIAAAGVDDDRLLADRVAGVRPAIGEAPADDRKVGAGDDLARMHIDPAPVAHHQIGRLAPGRDVDQRRRHLGPGFRLAGANRRRLRHEHAPWFAGLCQQKQRSASICPAVDMQ